MHHWYTVHRKVAVETQTLVSYVRNEVVRPLTSGAAEYDAIVEEGFPIEGLDDWFVMRGATNEEEDRANAARMFKSVRTFIQLDSVDSHPMSEHCFWEATRAR